MILTDEQLRALQGFYSLGVLFFEAFYGDERARSRLERLMDPCKSVNAEEFERVAAPLSAALLSCNSIELYGVEGAL